MSAMLDQGSGGGGLVATDEDDSSSSSTTSTDSAIDTENENDHSIDMGQSDPTGGFKTDGTSDAAFVSDPDDEGGTHVVGGTPEEQIATIDETVMPEVREDLQESSSDEQETSTPTSTSSSSDEIPEWLTTEKGVAGAALAFVLAMAAW